MSKRIEDLKKQLRQQYTHYQSVNPSYGCGHALTKYISAEYSEACRALNATLDELATIDPNTPTTRF